MAKANFYLKSKPNDTGEQLIILSFSYDGERMIYSSGQTIDPKFWNKSDQRAKKSLTGYKTLNEYLQGLEQAVFSIYRKSSADNVNPTVKHLKYELDLYLKKLQPKRERDFSEHFEEFITAKSPSVELKTLQKYRTLLKTLKDFSKQTKTELSFETMDVKLYDKYLAFRVNANKSDETIYKEIALLKTFLHWCVLREYTTNVKFIKQFIVKERQKKVLSLTNDELFLLYHLPLEKQTQQIIRDMFCFSCFTSLRYSDILQVSKEKIIDNTLSLYQVKTKDNVSIQLNTFAIAILERNNFNFPIYSNYYANKVLREVAKLAGFNRSTSKLMVSGNKRVEIVKPLHKAISFHIGRKSNVTLSLARGMRHEIVMSQTGHKKLSTMQKYIAVTDEMIKDEVNRAWKSEEVNRKK